MLFSYFSPRSLALTLALLPTAPLAHEADAQCAVVVSSWRTLQKAQQFRADHPEFGIQRIYKTYDGWYSVAADLLPEKRADATIRQLKSSSAIPGDSFCLEYALYLDTAWEAKKDAPVTVAAPAPAPETPEAPVEMEMAEAGPSALPETRSVEATPEPVLTADTTTPADAMFGTDGLSVSDIRVLQAGLAYLGHYYGALDGVWGRGTQAAFEIYARTAFEAPATNSVAVELLGATLDTWQREDWRLLDLPDFDVSLQIPDRHVDAIDQMDGSLNLVSTDGTMTGRIILSSAYITDGLHSTVLEYHAHDSEPEQVRQDGLWITTARDDVSKIHMRSFWSDTLEQWVSMFLTHPVAQDNMANYMIATFQQGAGDNLFLPETSVLFDMAKAQGRDLDLDLTTEAVAFNDEVDTSDMTQNVSSRSPQTMTALSSKSAPLPHGSGFFINADGAIMTSHFVANECQSLMIDGAPGLLLAASDEFDLAIVRKLDAGKVDHFLSFAPQAAQIDAPITASGYLAPTNASLTLAGGAVYEALGRDESWSSMQIATRAALSAGGPIVDSSGNVVGVVSTLFEAGIAQDALGTPNGISYAVRGELGTVLAQLSGIEVTKAEAASGSKDLAAHLDQATVSISCGQSPAS